MKTTAVGPNAIARTVQPARAVIIRAAIGPTATDHAQIGRRAVRGTLIGRAGTSLTIATSSRIASGAAPLPSSATPTIGRGLGLPANRAVHGPRTGRKARATDPPTPTMRTAHRGQPIKVRSLTTTHRGRSAAHRGRRCRRTALRPDRQLMRPA